jgi:cytochrome P450
MPTAPPVAPGQASRAAGPRQGSDLGLFAVETRTSDPYPVYARFRKEAPVHHDAARGLWIVSRYDDVVHVLRAADEFSTRGVSSFEATLLGDDPPQHAQVRRLFDEHLDLRSFAALEPPLRATARATVARLRERRRFDVVGELATPLPLRLVLELLGLDPGLLERARRWSAAVVEGGSGPEQAELHAFFEAHVRRVAAGEVDVAWLRGLVRALGAAGAIDIAKLLLVAGTETTSNLIGNAVLALLTHAAVLEGCRSDLGRLPQVIEETLRFDAPVQWVRRIATRGATLGGARLPAGAHVAALIGSANRDESKFEDADRFVPTRKMQAHISFGSGAHVCPGARLARMEARVVLEELLRDGWALEMAQDRASLEWQPSTQVRGLKRLEVETRPG